MSDIKLFKIYDQQVTELTGSAAKIEKSLQSQIETNLETYLGYALYQMKLIQNEEERVYKKADC